MPVKRPFTAALCLLLGLCLLFTGCARAEETPPPVIEQPAAFSGDPFIVLDENIPAFRDNERTTRAFERYSELDSLGRCGVAYACVGTELMPTGPRGSIGQVKPTGWHTVKYDCVDGKYLYNRCHLIGYQLTGENANERNLITGTRYLNVEGMLPFENLVADYVKETGNHVLYRVTPVFSEDNLVADGVQIEALSVEDDGSGVCFNIFAYNIQPGIEIDYRTGESRETGEYPTPSDPAPSAQPDDRPHDYILNTASRRFHTPDCGSVGSIKAENRSEFTGTRDQLIAQGYSPCKSCNP